MSALLHAMGGALSQQERGRGSTSGQGGQAQGGDTPTFGQFGYGAVAAAGAGGAPPMDLGGRPDFHQRQCLAGGFTELGELLIPDDYAMR